MSNSIESNRGSNNDAITVDFVSRYKNKYILENLNKGVKPYLLNSVVKESMKKEMGLRDFFLSGPIEISLGTNCSLLVDENQVEVFEVGYGIYSASELPFYASVVNAEDNSRKVEASVKFFSGVRPKTENHFIVSQGLAEKLKLKNSKNIKIIEVYQKSSDTDLLDH
jgi:hypothetical protein